MQAVLGAALVGHAKPITLEVGCGHGHFFTAYAAAHRDELCVAVDLLRDRIERARRKTDRAGLNNVTWIHGEAGLMLEALPAETRLGRIFLLFSDPWPKRRHWKNRVLQLDFLSEIAAKSIAGAQFCFRTDHPHYYEWALRRVRMHPCWRLEPDGAWPFEQESVFQQRAEAGYQSWVARRTQAPVPPVGGLLEPVEAEDEQTD